MILYKTHCFPPGSRPFSQVRRSSTTSSIPSTTTHTAHSGRPRCSLTGPSHWRQDSAPSKVRVLGSCVNALSSAPLLLCSSSPLDLLWSVSTLCRDAAALPLTGSSWRLHSLWLWGCNSDSGSDTTLLQTACTGCPSISAFIRKKAPVEGLTWSYTAVHCWPPPSWLTQSGFWLIWQEFTRCPLDWLLLSKHLWRLHSALTQYLYTFHNLKTFFGFRLELFQPLFVVSWVFFLWFHSFLLDFQSGFMINTHFHSQVKHCSYINTH